MTDPHFKKISPQELVDMEGFCAGLPVRIALAYARTDNLLFGEQIYRSDARLWLHESLAKVVAEAAHILKTRHPDFNLVLYDGLRTTDAQEKMLHTKKVQANRHWIEGTPRLLSPPGKGAHPRGMAIDLSLEYKGKIIDMGTVFDYLAEDSSKEKNPAHRDYPHVSDEARKNRTVLTSCMMGAAAKLGISLFPLPQEWWDFRLPADIYELYAPLSDRDLPKEMQLVLPSGINSFIPVPERR